MPELILLHTLGSDLLSGPPSPVDTVTVTVEAGNMREQ